MNNILKEARPILEITPYRWNNLVRSVSVEMLGLPPVLNEWSALDCLRHLVDAERQVFPVRIKALLAGQDFAAFDPDSQGTKPSSTQSPTDLVADFAALRVLNLALFDQITESDLTRQARHQELGIVSMSELLHEWAGHDLMHTVQAERALMQPFIRGCGPWLSYFQDHVAASS